MENEGSGSGPVKYNVCEVDVTCATLIRPRTRE